jgi:hypothetical protein
MNGERPPSARRAVARAVRHRAGLRYIGWRSAFEFPRDVLTALWQGAAERSLDPLRFELWSWAATVRALSEPEMRAALERIGLDSDSEEIIENVALGLLVSERLEGELANGPQARTWCANWGSRTY